MLSLPNNEYKQNDSQNTYYTFENKLRIFSLFVTAATSLARIFKINYQSLASLSYPKLASINTVAIGHSCASFTQ